MSGTENMKCHSKMQRQKKLTGSQTGLTLLEVMITVVILSLGLLGLAGLQVTGLKNNRNAYYQTVAAQVVQDLAERIKADQAGVLANNYDNLFGENAISADSTKCKDPTGVVVFSDRAACLVTSLPGGQIRVREVTGGSNTFYVAARWTDLELGAANAGWSGDTSISACGAVSNGTNCSYSLVTP